MENRTRSRKKVHNIPLVEIAANLAKLENKNGHIVVFDGGFRLGRFSEGLLKHIPNVSITGFEPDPRSLKAARKKFNDVDNVMIVKSALGAEIGTAEFFRGEKSATNSLKPRPETESSPYYPQTATLKGGFKVRVTTIEEQCRLRNLSKIDILKLDLQGGELDALKGATALLKDGRTSVILAEVAFVQKYEDQPMLWEIWRYLSFFGYTLHSFRDLKIGVYDDEPMSMRQYQWNQADAIFISPAVRKALDGTDPQEFVEPELDLSIAVPIEGGEMEDLQAASLSGPQQSFLATPEEDGTPDQQPFRDAGVGQWAAATSEERDGETQTSVFLPDRRVILHCGAQKTASTSLQHYLGDHLALLHQQGIGFPPRYQSKGRLDSLHRILVRSRHPDTRAKAIASAGRRLNELFEPEGINTLLISNESMLGEPVRPSSKQFYPMAKDSASALQEIFQGCEVHLRFVIRDLPSLLSSYYVQYVRRGGQCTFADFLRFLDINTISWMAAIEPLISAFDESRLKVFDYADLMARPDRFLAAMLDQDLGVSHPPFDPSRYVLNRSYGGSLLKLAMHSNRMIGKISSTKAYPKWVRARNVALKPLSFLAGERKPRIPRKKLEHLTAVFEQDRRLLRERGLLVDLSD